MIDVIVSFSTVEDIGTGFRSKLFMPQWRVTKENLRQVVLLGVPPIDARIVIGQVAPARTVIGIEDYSFVVETCIPADGFKQLTIREKNGLVLDTIFESIEAACASLHVPLPSDVGRIWQEAREAV